MLFAITSFRLFAFAFVSKTGPWLSFCASISCTRVDLKCSCGPSVVIYLILTLPLVVYCILQGPGNTTGFCAYRDPIHPRTPPMRLVYPLLWKRMSRVRDAQLPALSSSAFPNPRTGSLHA